MTYTMPKLKQDIVFLLFCYSKYISSLQNPHLWIILLVIKFFSSMSSSTSHAAASSPSSQVDNILGRYNVVYKFSSVDFCPVLETDSILDISRSEDQSTTGFISASPTDAPQGDQLEQYLRSDPKKTMSRAKEEVMKAPFSISCKEEFLPTGATRLHVMYTIEGSRGTFMGVLLATGRAIFWLDSVDQTMQNRTGAATGDYMGATTGTDDQGKLLVMVAFGKMDASGDHEDLGFIAKHAVEMEGRARSLSAKELIDLWGPRGLVLNR